MNSPLNDASTNQPVTLDDGRIIALCAWNPDTDPSAAGAPIAAAEVKRLQGAAKHALAYRQPEAFRAWAAAHDRLTAALAHGTPLAEIRAALNEFETAEHQAFGNQ